MTEANFNKRQCIRALRKLGFYENSKRGRLHDKWFPPLDLSRNIHPGQPHFIMVPRHNELHIQWEILKELEAMGGRELVERFKRYF